MPTTRKPTPNMQVKRNRETLATLPALLAEVPHTCTRPATSYGPAEYRMDTEAGPMRFVHYGSWVHMQFDDVDRAKRTLPGDFGWGLRGNPFNGKWNLHFTYDHTPAERDKWLRLELGRVLGDLTFPVD